MIVSFDSRHLRRFHETGNEKGIRADLRERVRHILNALDTAKSLDDVVLLNRRLHGYVGGGKGTFSLDVNKTWRITFTWSNDGPAHVDLTQPH